MADRQGGQPGTDEQGMPTCQRSPSFRVFRADPWRHCVMRTRSAHPALISGVTSGSRRPRGPWESSHTIGRSPPGARSREAKTACGGPHPGATKKRRVAGLTRRRSLQVPPRDAGLLPRSQGRKAEPPLWGYRRLWASVHVVEGLSVEKKRGLRVRREHHLGASPTRSSKPSGRRAGAHPGRPHRMRGGAAR